MIVEQLKTCLSMRNPGTVVVGCAGSGRKLMSWFNSWGPGGNGGWWSGMVLSAHASRLLVFRGLRDGFNLLLSVSQWASSCCRTRHAASTCHDA